MKKYRLKRGRWPEIRAEQTGIDFPILALLFLCFLLGSVLGCFVGSGVEEETEEITKLISQSPDFGIIGYLHSLWQASRYHIVVLLAATSLIGVFVIPLTAFLRGYFLTCAAAAVITALPEHGILAALISCGIGALLTIPSLFLLQLDGFALSKRLRALSAGKSGHFSNQNIPQHMGIAVVCLITAAATDHMLIPWLLSYIF